MMRARYLAAFAMTVVCGIATVVEAAETITYTYDAKGRIVKAARSGSVNNGVVVDYIHDKAGNRTKVKIAGSSK